MALVLDQRLPGLIGAAMGAWLSKGCSSAPARPPRSRASWPSRGTRAMVLREEGLFGVQMMFVLSWRLTGLTGAAGEDSTVHVTLDDNNNERAELKGVAMT